MFGETSDISDYTIWLFIIMHLIYLMPTIAYSSRRLHDIGRSGMTLFMVLIPIVGFLYCYLILLNKEMFHQMRMEKELHML